MMEDQPLEGDSVTTPQEGTRKQRRDTHRAQRAEEKAKAAYDDWLKNNMNYQEVADIYTNGDRANARRLVHKGRALINADVEEQRDRLAVDVLEVLAAMKTAALNEGDPAAANSFKGLSERLAKLYGLDAPVKTELSGKDGGQIIMSFGAALRPQPFQDADLEVEDKE